MSNLFGPYDSPIVLRDSDDDGSPGPIDCVRTKGLNLKQKWLGDTVHLTNVVTQTFEILFSNDDQPKNLRKWISKLNEYADAGSWHEELDLYGIKIPKCRIIKVEAPTSESLMNNALGRGQLNLTVEQRTCGDFSNLNSYSRTAKNLCYECIDNLGGAVQAGGVFVEAKDYQAAYNQCVPGVDNAAGVRLVKCSEATPAITPATFQTDDYGEIGTLFSQYCEYIEDISEDFNFNYGKSEAVELSHSVTVKLFDSCPKGVNASKAFMDTGGPGEPGDNVPVSQEGNLDGEYSGNDGMADGLSVCREGQPNIDDALNLARKMLDENVPHFGIAYYGGLLQELDQRNVIPYYTETQNLITGEASMTKRLTLYKNKDVDNDWSADAVHSLVVDTTGVATVTERGKIRGYKKVPAANPELVNDASYQNALDGMNEVLGANFVLAETRCVDFWESHREFFKNHYGGANEPAKNDATYGLDNLNLHVHHPLEKTRSFNAISQECSYSISFTTSPNIFEKFMADRVLTASRDEAGAITVSEKNNLTQYTPKGEDYNHIAPDLTVTPNKADTKIDNPIEIIFPEDFSNSKTRAMAFYNGLSQDFSAPDDGCPEPLKIKSRDMSWDPNGRALNYTLTWATDKSISCSFPNEHGVRKVQTESKDKIPQRMRQEHPIANWKMLVHDAEQTNLGERTVTLTAVLDRTPKVNMLVTPTFPETSLTRLADLARVEILNVFSDDTRLVADDMFVKKCRYTFNSKWEATFEVTIAYIQQRQG